MTSNFLDTFSGSAVSPSEVAYAAYSFSSSLTLFWPQFSAGQTNIAARFMNLTATAGSLNVNMPDATLVSVGYDVIIFNAGSNTFNVVDFNGGAIATIATGQTYYVLLNSNTTQAGGWQTVQFGVGTGSASAAALAGAGLLATAGMLNVNFDAQTQSADYTISSSSRAILQVWTGGAGTVTLPSASSVADGFFFPFANNGSGSAVVTPSGGDLIDGESTSIFSQSQSAFIVSSGAAWYTIGKGLQNNFSVTLLNLNVAGSSDVTETSAQAQNIVQQYTGALTGNINVIVPNTVQLYYVFNNTTGSHTLTVKTAAGTGVVITQGTHVILYCDGTNVINAFTTNTVTIGSVFYSLGTVGGTANALIGSTSNFILQLGTEVTFNPLSLNTGPATLNVQGTGVIAIKKIGAVGLVDLAADDLIPGLPIAGYYDGTYWIALNIIYEGTYELENSDFTLTFANWLNDINCTAAINITLSVTTDFPSYFYTTIFANGGAVTLIPDAGDSIQGLGAGTHYILPKGSSAKLTTDATGNWVLFLLTTPFIANDASTNATMYPTWVTANSGALPLKVSSTKLSFNPSTGILTSVGFVGNITGNASTATALQNARTIGGTSFDGTANITVATATGGFTVSGGDLALGANNITMSGSLGATGTRLTKGWFTDLQVTNAIAGSITGNAATVTTNANLTGDVTSSGNATTIKTNVALAGSPTTTTQSSSDNSTKIATTAFVKAASLPAYNSISGCLLSSIAGNHTTATITVGTGQAADSTNATYITSAGYSWAASNGNAINGTDAASSTLANSTTYHMFLCNGGSGTGTFCSASLTPTFPTGYTTYSRRIGSFNTNGSGAPLPYASIAINGGGILNYLTTQVLDVNDTGLTSASRKLYTLTSVPTGVRMQPLCRFLSPSAVYVILTSPDETDVAPATSVSSPAVPLFDMEDATGIDQSLLGMSFITTNTSGQIAARASSGSGNTIGITTRGWIDFRQS